MGLQPVAHVGVREDLLERAAALVLANHVRRDAFLLRRADGEEREDVAKKIREPGHEVVFLPNAPQLEGGTLRERNLSGVDDAGNEERIVIWIERKAGAVWAVGRSVNPHLRNSDEARADEYVFEGYELDDALEHANDVLEDDVSVLERDGRPADTRPFLRRELLGPLERWFFGRSNQTT